MPSVRDTSAPRWSRRSPSTCSPRTSFRKSRSGRPGAVRSRRQPHEVWALGVGGLCGNHALYFTALRLAPPAEAGLINYLWPLLIVLFAGLLPQERLKLHHLAGALLGLIGTVVLVASRANLGFAESDTPGLAPAFLPAFVWASYSVLARQFARLPTDVGEAFCS